MREKAAEPVAETVELALARARGILVAADTPNSALDARLLLQAVLKIDHAAIITHPDRILTASEVRLLDQYLARRCAHEPVSKILGQRDFYGRCFQVTGDVLDPRADTEMVVELALELKLPPAARVLDLGSGSGALICTLLAEWPKAIGLAVDFSAVALDVTARNAAALGVADRLQVLQGSWLEPVSGIFDVIVSNPPYIASAVIADLEPDVRQYDPHLALDGGADGLSCYRAIAGQAGVHLAPDGHMIVEIGAGQAADVTAIFGAAGLVLTRQRHDLGGHVRALAFAKSSA